jgi:hypothetical protein
VTDANLKASSYRVTDGGEITPDKFTVRLGDILMRADDGLPLLFDSKAEAEAWIKANA